MKHIFTTFWVVFACVVANAQTLQLVDAKTSEAIVGALISSRTSAVHTTTNAQGKADLSIFKQAQSITITSFQYIKVELQASEWQSNDLIQVSMEPSAVQLSQVQVNAARWVGERNTVTNAIQGISAKDIALQNPQTAADMLKHAGVFIQKSQQAGGSPLIRGFSTNRLLYVVDGIRMNTAIFRSGNIQNVIALDPFAFDNVDVIFGPGSVMYGSDAIGGIMAFQTLKPNLSFQKGSRIVSGKAVSRFSTANNENTFHFDINTGGEKWAYIASISASKFDNLRMGSFGPEEYLRKNYVSTIDGQDVTILNTDPKIQNPTAYTQMNLMQKIRFKPNAAWDFVFSSHYSASSDYGRYDRHLRFRNGLQRSAEWNYGPQIWNMQNFEAKHFGHNVVYDEMEFRVAYQHFEESRIDRNYNSDARNTKTEQVDAYSVNLDFEKSIGKSILAYGAEAVLNAVSSAGTVEFLSNDSTGQSSARYPNADWNSYAAFATFSTPLTSKLKSIIGIRYNVFGMEADFTNNAAYFNLPIQTAEVNNSALTGNIGLQYNASENFGIRLQFANAFRAPNVDDLGKFFDSQAGTVTVPNPNLGAETAYNTELGFSTKLGKRFEFDFAAYYTLLQNALVRRNFKLNGQDSIQYNGEFSQVQAVQNAAQATIFGVQASALFHLGSGLSVYSQINYQTGEEELEDGTFNPARSVAPVYGLTRLNYVFKGVEMQWSAEYSGGFKFNQLSFEEQGKPELYATDKNGNPESPSWFTLNWKALYALNSNWKVSGGVENILDKRYKPYSSGIVSPGRNMIFSLQYQF